MKIKLKENSIQINSINPIRDYLKNLGIQKINSFINKPDECDELDPYLLNNMETCIDELYYGFINNKTFFIQVDSDVDGMTSAAIFYRYFKNLYPNSKIKWRIHDGKEHGVILNTVPQDVDYIILPDSGSMQLKEQKILAEQNKKIIILDHHSVSEKNENENIILVNNQCSDLFYNKDLSGAGITFKTIQAYTLKYCENKDIYKYFYDLAALGILSDAMKINNLDNNYIIYQGLKNINSKIFKAMIKHQSRGIPDPNNPTKTQVVFYISPLINGVIRTGEKEEKENLFKAFIEEPTEEYITTTWRDIVRKETFYEYVARTSYNTKNRQDTLKEKYFNFLKEKIKKEGLDENQIIVVVSSDNDKLIVPPNITGIIAMELLKYYNKPVLVLRPKIENGELVYTGSGRGKFAEGFTSFLQLIKDSKFTTYGEGHAFAFGVSIPAKNLQFFINESNKKLQNINFNEDSIEVDAIFNSSNINYKMLYEFAKYDYIYGNSIPQPLIAIETTCNSNNIISMGKKGDSIKIIVDKLPCIKFKDEKILQELQKNKYVKLCIVGKANINSWNNLETTQLFIDDIDIKPETINTLF